MLSLALSPPICHNTPILVMTSGKFAPGMTSYTPSAKCLQKYTLLSCIQNHTYTSISSPPTIDSTCEGVDEPSQYVVASIKFTVCQWWRQNFSFASGRPADTNQDLTQRHGATFGCLHKGHGGNSNFIFPPCSLSCPQDSSSPCLRVSLIPFPQKNAGSLRTRSYQFFYIHTQKGDHHEKDESVFGLEGVPAACASGNESALHCRLVRTGSRLR